LGSLLNLTGLLIPLDVWRRVYLQLPWRWESYQTTGKENSSSCPMGSSLTSPPTVYSVFLLETLQTALSGADLYYWFVSGYGNIDHLTSPYASSFDVPIMGSVVSLSVQFFFVYRIWVLAGGKKGSWWLCILICLVILSVV
jgi:hypothetical protein